MPDGAAFTLAPHPTAHRLKVAFLLPHFYAGGAEGVALKLLEGLDRGTFRPVLILQNRVGELVDKVPRDVEVYDLGGRRASASVRSLARLYDAENFDIVQTFTNAASVLCQAARALSRHRPKTILSEHTPLSLFMAGAKGRILRRLLMHATYPSADRIAAPIASICAEHETLLGARCPRTVVLPNPIVETGLAPTDIQVAPRARRIMTLSRLSPEKRPDLMVRAFAAAFGDTPDATLTIWGEGGMRAALEALAFELGVADRVHLPGYTTDVRGALANADLFLCTSEREGFGNAIVEAMAAGVPVLSLDCPVGPRVLLQGGLNGRLVEAEDAATLAAQMKDFADDPVARLDAAKRAAVAAKTYDIGAALRAHERVYSELANVVPGHQN